eukprot:6187828-Pleurochrysis_carterae.AAC.4
MWAPFLANSIGQLKGTVGFGKLARHANETIVRGVRVCTSGCQSGVRQGQKSLCEGGRARMRWSQGRPETGKARLQRGEQPHVVRVPMMQLVDVAVQQRPDVHSAVREIEEAVEDELKGEQAYSQAEPPSTDADCAADMP